MEQIQEPKNAGYCQYCQTLFNSASELETHVAICQEMNDSEPESNFDVEMVDLDANDEHADGVHSEINPDEEMVDLDAKMSDFEIKNDDNVYKYCIGCKKYLPIEIFYSHFRRKKNCKNKYDKNTFMEMMNERRKVTKHRTRSKRKTVKEVISAGVQGVKKVINTAKRVLNSKKSLKEDGPILANTRLHEINFSLSPTQPDTPGLGNCLCEALFDQIR